jgi:hypothetical protein
MKNSNEQTLKEVIKELLEAYRLQDGLQESKLIHAWDAVAGAFVAKNTEKIYIRNKTLYIHLRSPALKNELSYEKSKLIDSLNKAVGSAVIRDIVML